jgi:hypothetical protein
LIKTNKDILARAYVTLADSAAFGRKRYSIHIMYILLCISAYGVYISQLIRYGRASSNYSDFLKRHLHLRNRLLDQGYKKIRLIRSLKKFIFRYQDLVEIYSVSAETIINDAFSYSENV